MDVVFLSRLQFAFTIIYHYFFVPLTIGLAVMIAIIEIMNYTTGKKIYEEMASFWIKLLGINFAIGVATGITMEFQFGTNWAAYSRYVGDIFGAPLAAEGVFAFFLESTFIGLLFFGRKKISRFMKMFSAIMVALGTNMSAFWIIAAASWQQTPAGYKIENGKAILTSFSEALFNPSTVSRLVHTLLAAYTVAAFFVLAVSAYYLLKNKNLDLAKTSMKFAVIFGLVVGLAQFGSGHEHAQKVAQNQPAKLAAFEALWDTQAKAPLIVFAIPDVKNEKNNFEISIPGGLSFLATNDFNATVKGIKDFPLDERPPILPTFLSFHTMVALGGLFAFMLVVAALLLPGGKLYRNKLVLKALMFTMPLTYVANELGWMTTEVGRQPWIVYGLLKTSDAFSPILPAWQIIVSLILFAVVYAGLFAAFFYLMKNTISKYESPSLTDDFNKANPRALNA